MQYLFIVSVLLFAFTFGTKSIIHAVLDNNNGYKIDFASARGYVYFLPYEKDVSEKDRMLKKACNFFQKLSMLFLLIFVIVFFLQIFRKE